jgi:hypothetical protein
MLPEAGEIGVESVIDALHVKERFSEGSSVFLKNEA